MKKKSTKHECDQTSKLNNLSENAESKETLKNTREAISKIHTRKPNGYLISSNKSQAIKKT